MPSDIVVSGTPSPVLSGTGSPALIYNADIQMQNMVYIQLDAKPGQRLWLCHNGTGVYAWEQFRPFVAAVATPALTATLGFTIATNSYSGSVSQPQAAVGMTARMEPISLF